MQESGKWTWAKFEEICKKFNSNAPDNFRGPHPLAFFVAYGIMDLPRGGTIYVKVIFVVPQVFGWEHILYMLISAAVGAAALVWLKVLAKHPPKQELLLKILAALLLVAILTNRLSQVFRYGTVRWYCLIPDSFCGMSSLVLALAVLFGKRDNPVLHFVWLLGLFGGIATVVYPSFVSQDASFFYIPTISGLLHHSFAAITAIAVLLCGWLEVTYKKWYCVILGFTCYLTVGAFLMSVFEMSDAFHIVEPLLPGTPLTAWVMAPMYLAGHGLIFLIIELFRRNKKSV